MPIATYFFFISLGGLLAMGVSKTVSLGRNRPSLFSFLSKYDASLGAYLIRLSETARALSVSLRNHSVILIRALRHLMTVYLHQILQSAERRVRAWREFARERKIERRSASVFIKDVFEYKNQLKQNSNTHQP